MLNKFEEVILKHIKYTVAVIAGVYDLCTEVPITVKSVCQNIDTEKLYEWRYVAPQNIIT